MLGVDDDDAALLRDEDDRIDEAVVPLEDDLGWTDFGSSLTGQVCFTDVRTCAPVRPEQKAWRG